MFKKIARVLATLTFILSISFAYYANARPIFLGYAKTYEVYFHNGSYAQPQILSGNILPLGVKGEGCVVEDKSVEELFLDFNARILFTEEIDGGISYYGYSPKIRYKARIKEQTINLHVFVKNQRCRVGSPMIYGSY